MRGGGQFVIGGTRRREIALLATRSVRTGGGRPRRGPGRYQCPVSDPRAADVREGRAATVALLVLADVLLVLTLLVVVPLTVESRAGVVMWLVIGSAAALVVVRNVQFLRSERRSRAPSRHGS